MVLGVVVCGFCNERVVGVGFFGVVDALLEFVVGFDFWVFWGEWGV